jgi:peptidyl-prolyl cis-trans isomerase C
MDRTVSACSVKNTPQGPRTPIKVNGVTISRALISREVQNHPANSPITAWKAAALALVVREALTQEVKRRAIEAEPRADGEGRRETADEARMRALVEGEVTVPQPTEAECRRYYEHNVARFRSPDLYEAVHILFSASRDDADAYAAARQRANTVIAELRANPEAFERLARAVSDCPSREVGGNLGQIGPGQTTPAFEAALSTMQPGEITPEPVETPYGAHVVRLDRKIAGQMLPFEIVHERIAAYLARAVRQRAEAQYVARLLAQCRIEGLEVPEPRALNVH